jgi:hypothetical protein
MRKSFFARRFWLFLTTEFRTVSLQSFTPYGSMSATLSAPYPLPDGSKGRTALHAHFIPLFSVCVVGVDAAVYDVLACCTDCIGGLFIVVRFVALECDVARIWLFCYTSARHLTYGSTNLQ